MVWHMRRRTNSSRICNAACAPSIKRCVILLFVKGRISKRLVLECIHVGVAREEDEGNAEPGKLRAVLHHGTYARQWPPTPYASHQLRFVPKEALPDVYKKCKSPRNWYRLLRNSHGRIVLQLS